MTCAAAAAATQRLAGRERSAPLCLAAGGLADDDLQQAWHGCVAQRHASWLVLIQCCSSHTPHPPTTDALIESQGESTSSRRLGLCSAAAARAPTNKPAPTWLMGMKMTLTTKPMKPTAMKPMAVSRATFVNSFCSRGRRWAGRARRGALAAGSDAPQQGDDAAPAPSSSALMAAQCTAGLVQARCRHGRPPRMEPSGSH